MRAWVCIRSSVVSNRISSAFLDLLGRPGKATRISTLHKHGDTPTDIYTCIYIGNDREHSDEDFNNAYAAISPRRAVNGRNAELRILLIIRERGAVLCLPPLAITGSYLGP